LRCLLDTSAAYAIADARDQHHETAIRFLRSGRHDFVTTSIVVGESFTTIRRRLGYRVAHEWASLTRSSDRTVIVHLNEADENKIWSTIDRLGGVKVSYADASLVLLAELTGVDAVFAFDADFRGAGLNVVPEV
jgi:predicted nucleic acid-binding protein